MLLHLLLSPAVTARFSVQLQTDAEDKDYIISSELLCFNNELIPEAPAYLNLCFEQVTEGLRVLNNSAFTVAVKDDSKDDGGQLIIPSRSFVFYCSGSLSVSDDVNFIVTDSQFSAYSVATEEDIEGLALYLGQKASESTCMDNKTAAIFTREPRELIYSVQTAIQRIKVLIRFEFHCDWMCLSQAVFYMFQVTSLSLKPDEKGQVNSVTLCPRTEKILFAASLTLALLVLNEQDLDYRTEGPELFSLSGMRLARAVNKILHIIDWKVYPNPEELKAFAVQLQTDSRAALLARRPQLQMRSEK